MNTIEIWILVCASAGLAVFNWEFSVRARRFHGVYRFFSNEAILILLLLNWRFWFLAPFSWNQIISWVLLIGSLPVALEGFHLLKVVGKPEGQFENTTRLVTVGMYHYIRHPLYASLILLGLGICFKQISLPGVLLALLNIGAMTATAKIEEREMIATFGTEYERYMHQSKMFIPFVL